MLEKIRKRISALSPIEIFIALTIIALTVFLVKYFGIKREWKIIRVEVIKKNWTENYDPYGYRAPFWLSDKIKVGQTEKDPNSGRTIATLVGLEDYERGGEEADIYLTVKVEVYLNQRSGQYQYRDLPLELGSSITLNLNNILVVGQVTDTDVPPAGYPTKNLLVTIFDRNVEDWICNQIKPGLTMRNRANNEVVAQVVSVKTEPPTYQLIVSENSRLTIDNSPNKDLTVTVKIKAQQIDGRWYFGGHQNIKVGGAIYITPDTAAMPAAEVRNIEVLPN